MIEILTTKQRMEAFAELGRYLQNPDEELMVLVRSAKQYNAWFTSESTLKAVQAIAGMLNAADLERWMEALGKRQPDAKPLAVGLVLAGNIPLVGFHDILCVLATGNKALVKLSSHDQKLIPFILLKLTEMEPGFSGQIEYVDRLKDFDAVIATGSDNTSRYFEYYFGKVPHIIRRNRNSIAVLTGNENEEDLSGLGHDIFDYFGLGCRNVSKIYVPRGYEFRKFFEGIESFSEVINHHKYNNNYDYNKSIFLVNSDRHLDNGFLLVKEDEHLASPLAVLYYQEYDDIRMLEQELKAGADRIQCIVSAPGLINGAVEFGDSQKPRLWDYADGIDTLAFLEELGFRG